jgi:hypothetical protein
MLIENYGSVIGKWCFQKLLALVFQMEESKQNTGWREVE